VCSEVSSGHCGRIEVTATLTASLDRAPFHDAQTYNELATAIRSGRIPPLPKGYSSALSSVIKSMLNINVSHILPHQSTLNALANVSLTQPAMRPSTQQLLRIEQLMYAKKLIDVNKM